jgi:AraC-like DNA-binding protein
MQPDDHPPIRLAHVRGGSRLFRGMKDCFGFIVIQEGWVDFSHAGGPPEREQAGGMLLIQPGEVYCEHRRSPDSELDVVMLSRRTLDVPPPAARRSARFAADDPLTRTLVRLVDAVRTKSDALALETAVCEATRNLAGPEPIGSVSATRDRRAVKKARELLLDRFRENVRLDELAEHAGLDKYRLVRAFRARHGVPPYEYLTHARILLARKLLRAGKRASDVAGEVGYNDQSQLHRHFVRIVGTTPGRYRAGT